MSENIIFVCLPNLSLPSECKNQVSEYGTIQAAGADQHQPAWVFSSSGVHVGTVRRMAAVRPSSRFRLMDGWGRKEGERQRREGSGEKNVRSARLMVDDVGGRWIPRSSLAGWRAGYRYRVAMTCPVIRARGPGFTFPPKPFRWLNQPESFLDFFRIKVGPLRVICINLRSTSGVFGAAATPFESMTNCTVLVAQRTPAGTCMASGEIHYSSLYPSADGSLCV